MNFNMIFKYADYKMSCYILFIISFLFQDSNGKVLDKWNIASREEEHIMLQQFLRFGETKSIAQEIILQDTKEQQDLLKLQSSRAESEIKKFIERSNHSVHNYMRGLEPRHLFGSRLPFVPLGSRLMTPPSLLNFSPPLSQEVRNHMTSGVSSSPVTSSPLGRLQTMQPFDFHREQASPAVSPGLPGLPEKQITESCSSGSPKNMSLTPTSSKSVTPPYTPQMSESESTPIKPSPAMSLPIMQPGEQVSGRVLDFSSPRDQRDSYDDHSARHLRKPHAVKRTWTPSANFGTSFIGPNGKKRVLCTACNKTFCDKGALKIHYSAVHLKEMHKCTVEGCNMMFSSRRSRNRHSANPNPKLHMPQKRVKLPEGASIIDEDSGMSSNMVASPPSMVLPTSLPDGSMVSQFDSHELARSQALFNSALMAQMSVFPSPEKRYRLEDDLPKDLSVPEKRDSEGKLDRDSSPQHRSNRRKNMIPTRLTQPSQMSDENSDDEHLKEEGKDYMSMHHRFHLDNDHIAKNLYLKHKMMMEAEDDNEIELGEIRRGNLQPDRPNGHAQKEYPKIASLLSKSRDDEVIDYSKKSTINHSDESMSSDNEDMEDEDLPQGNSENISLPKMASVEDSVGELPLSKETPEECVLCNERFPSVEDVRTHLQNFHFKSMHFCSVSGCNAFFKSKRNQERHSADCERLRQSIQSHDTSKDSTKDEVSSPENHFVAVNGNNHAGDSSDGDDENSDTEIENKNENNNIENEIEKDEITGDENGINVHCHVCQSKFKDNLALKEHFESSHPKEMFPCIIKGCEKIFSTRKSRNRHSQNENLHGHLTESNN